MAVCIGHGCEHSSWLSHGCVHSSWLCSMPHNYVYSLPVVDISPESKCRVLSYSLQTLVSETLLLLLSTVIYCSPCSNSVGNESTDTPQAPSPCVDRSRPNRSDIYQSSTQNADAMTLHAYKVDDIVLSILIIATPGDLGLSHL
jgi:hypothetical protein